MSAVFRLSVFFAAAASVLVAALPDCYYGQTYRCLHPEIVGSVAIPFGPLFKTSPLFVWGTDNLAADEVKKLKAQQPGSAPADYTGPFQAVGWWLEYNDTMVNHSLSQNRKYTALALETKSTKNIGDGEDGCKDLLGPSCIDDLRSLLSKPDTIDSPYANYTWEYVYPAIARFFKHPPQNLSCPADLWGDGNNYTLPAAMELPLAIVSEDNPGFENESWIGRPSLTHSPVLFRFRSFEEQKEQAIVAITMSWPNEDEYIGNNVTVDMRCFRAVERFEDGAPGKRLSLSAMVLESLVVVVVTWGLLVVYW